jgi:hypothetical protein
MRINLINQGNYPLNWTKQAWFDVVVVSDFSGPRAPTFEVQTLFFLASWLENAGQARQFPLHLVCIGEPPQSVRRLAERCGASLTVHAPVGIERRGVSNKLRAFEVQHQTDRVLLLDADILVLSDFSSLSDLGYCISAAPDNKPRVPERYWKAIYPALGMQTPTERIASGMGEMGLTRLGQTLYSSQESEIPAMFPYYNTGALFLPWDCGLREVWEDHIRRIKALFNEQDEAWKSVGESNQAGFATALQQLRSGGLPFKRLPPSFHANYAHVFSRTLSLGEIKIFHAFELGVKVRSKSEDFRRSIHQYRNHLLSTMYWRWRLHYHFPTVGRSIALHLLPSVKDVLRMVHQMRLLYKRYVKEVL